MLDDSQFPLVSLALLAGMTLACSGCQSSRRQVAPVSVWSGAKQPVAPTARRSAKPVPPTAAAPETGSRPFPFSLDRILPGAAKDSAEKEPTSSSTADPPFAPAAETAPPPAPREPVLNDKGDAFPMPDDLPPVEPVRERKELDRGNEGEKTVPGPEDLIESIRVDQAEAHQTIEAGGRDVTVMRDGAVIFITGGCGRLTVQGGGNKIQADSVATLEVSGHENTVVLDILGGGVIVGDRNRVSWKRGLEGASPEVKSSGNDNEVSRLGMALSEAAFPLRSGAASGE